MKNVAVENGQVQQMKEQYFRPLQCAMADGVTVGHSVTPIHIAHVLVIIHHNLWLYGFSSLIIEITFCRVPSVLSMPETQTFQLQ
jgi:hypothetical protein